MLKVFHHPVQHLHLAERKRRRGQVKMRGQGLRASQGKSQVLFYKPGTPPAQLQQLRSLHLRAKRKKQKSSKSKPSLPSSYPLLGSSHIQPRVNLVF